MQIMVGGLARAAFGMGNMMFNDPVIKQITDLVMRVMSPSGCWR